MARSGKRAHRDALAGYGNATAAEIARFGPRGRQVDANGKSAAAATGRGGDGAPGREDRAEPAAPAKEPSRFDRAGKRQDGAGAAPAERTLSLAYTDALFEEESGGLRRKVALSAAVLAVLAFVSLGFIGAGDTHGLHYAVFSPLDVARALWEHAAEGVSALTGGALDLTDDKWSAENWRFYYALPDHAAVIGITLLCAVLLSVSGMLYQNVFKNPIAGPGMLGVSSGVSLGMMLLTYLYGASAQAMITERYLYCYGLGAAVLLFVILVGRKLSGKGRPYDIVTMLLVGMVLSQLIGFVVQFVTLFVMDPSTYQIYITLTQMLIVDTSTLSWAALGVACVASLAPVVYLRFRFNALAFDEQEVKLLGIDFARLRAVALICGAIMILAAQIHIGAVAMVSLIVPYLSRSWFGCEFRKQLVGNVCISTILLLVCRDLVDLVPFVGDGIGIGSMVSVMALPLFLFIMARHLRGWE